MRNTTLYRQKESSEYDLQRTKTRMSTLSITNLFLKSVSKPMNVIDIGYEVHYNISMCDLIDYEIYDKHKIKNKLLEKQDSKVEEELQKVQEEPITVTQ